jgi:hypothetical protein
MKFNELLTEPEQAISKEFIADVKADCASFLSVMMDNDMKPLWRGLKSGGGPYGVKRIRPHRMPLDTPTEWHTVLKELFIKYNLPGTRANTVFASKDFYHAGEYGEEVVIFPTNDFFYISGVEDMTLTIEKLTDKVMDAGYTELDENNEQVTKELEKIIGRPGAVVINQYPENNEEVYITGENYYYINSDMWNKDTQGLLI